MILYVKIIVCEDVAEERDSLCSHIEKYLGDISSLVKIITYNDGEALINDLDSLNPSEVMIAFLDIYMPGLSGIEVAKKIRKINKEMVIIFTTTSLDHGLDGYSVKALQYLIKPVGYPEIKDTLDGCMAMFAESLRYLKVFSNKIAIKIPLKDITYIEVLAHDCLIHTVYDTKKCRFTLDEMERQLSGSTFLRTHRSFIVNMSFIKNVVDNNFLLTTGNHVPIRKNGNLIVKQAYMDYVFAQTRGTLN